MTEVAAFHWEQSLAWVHTIQIKKSDMKQILYCLQIHNDDPALFCIINPPSTKSLLTVQIRPRWWKEKTWTKKVFVSESVEWPWTPWSCLDGWEPVVWSTFSSDGFVVTLFDRSLQWTLLVSLWLPVGFPTMFFPLLVSTLKNTP